jgi:uncharacterized membrane protein
MRKARAHPRNAVTLVFFGISLVLAGIVAIPCGDLRVLNGSYVESLVVLRTHRQDVVEGVMANYREVMDGIGRAVDAVGVLVIVAGALLATARFIVKRHGETGKSYRLYRQDLGRAILLGLEFLIAGDIIRTVVVAPTIENVLILGLIVLIRTFLSMALQLEVEGRWPWQRTDETSPLPHRQPDP